MRSTFSPTKQLQKMKRLKKGIFPLIIGIHIVLRLVFSDTFTNDEIITDASNMMPNELIGEKQAENNKFSEEKADFASLEVR